MRNVALIFDRLPLTPTPLPEGARGYCPSRTREGEIGPLAPFAGRGLG